MCRSVSETRSHQSHRAEARSLVVVTYQFTRRTPKVPSYGRRAMTRDVQKGYELTLFPLAVPSL